WTRWCRSGSRPLDTAPCPSGTMPVARYAYYTGRSPPSMRAAAPGASTTRSSCHVMKPTIPACLGRLKRRFSPALLRLGNDGAQALSGGGTAGVLALVGRELCLYLHVDASRIPMKQ